MNRRNRWMFEGADGIFIRRLHRFTPIAFFFFRLKEDGVPSSSRGGGGLNHWNRRNRWMNGRLIGILECQL